MAAWSGWTTICRRQAASKASGEVYKAHGAVYNGGPDE